MIRIGQVGAGPWATTFQAPMLASAEEFEFTAVWARRPEAAQALTAQYGGVRAIASYEEFLDSCEAISFAVPPDVQPRLAIAAAQAGKHLLLDKPLGRTLDDAVALEHAAAGVSTLVLLRNRFTTAAEQFLAAEGATGTVTATTTQVSVTVTTIYRTLVWQLIGFRDVTVRATGTAVPHPTLGPGVP